MQRVDSTPTAPEPSGTTSDELIPRREQLETAQNNPIKFMQDFEPSDDIIDIADAPDIPMQDPEVDTPTNQGLLDIGMRSCGRQYKMSRAMAESVSKREFNGNKNMYYMAVQSVFNGQMEADLFHDSHLEL